MNKNKTITTVTIFLFLGVVLLFIGALLPHVEAQQFYDPTYTPDINAQGSPRSALDNQRVLLIGDSHVAGPPGVALGNHLTAAGATYYARAGQVGWGVTNWYLHRREANNLIQRHHPTLLILILGGNDWSRVGNEDYRNTVHDFWREVHNSTHRSAPEDSMVSTCWIEPPNILGRRAAELQPRRDEVAEVIRSVVFFNHFVRSSDLTNTRTGRARDGIHFTPSGANDWIRQTIPRLEACVERQHPNIRQLSE